MKDIFWCGYGEGTIECYCDECQHLFEYEFDGGYPDFKDCQNELKDYGWLAKYIRGEWYDFCCQECFENWKKKHG